MQNQKSKSKTNHKIYDFVIPHSLRNPEAYTDKWIPACAAPQSCFPKLKLLLICLIFLATGCSQNILVQRLKDHGVTENNTTRLRFVSSEGAFGADTKITIEDTEVIKSVWTRINSATPTDLWFASGFQRIEFFTLNNSETPMATLRLNASDGANLEGDLWYHLDSDKAGYYGLWRCPGLDKLVSWHLRKEYEQRKSGS